MVFRLLDKMDKLGLEKVRWDLEKLIGKKNGDALFDLLAAKGTNGEKIEIAKKISEEGATELEEIIANADGLNIEVDFFLVRGLGYYTGPVFEIKLGSETGDGELETDSAEPRRAYSIGSVGGGGRYDNLLGIYGQGDCATGISLGIERLMYLIKEGNAKNAKKTYTKVFVASVKGYFAQSAKIADEFRKAGIPCEVDLNERNLGKQFEYANALGIKYVAIIGEKETKENKITLREMETWNEEMLDLENAIEQVKKP